MFDPTILFPSVPATSNPTIIEKSARRDSIVNETTNRMSDLIHTVQKIERSVDSARASYKIVAQETLENSYILPKFTSFLACIDLFDNLTSTSRNLTALRGELGAMDDMLRRFSLVTTDVKDYLDSCDSCMKGNGSGNRDKNGDST